MLPYVSKEQQSSNAYTHLSLQYHIGLAYEHLGNTAEAIKRYEEVMSYWGNADIEFDIIRDTKDRLSKLTS